MRVLKVEQGPLIRSWHIMTTRLAFRKWVGNSTFTCYVRVIHKKRQHKVRFLSPKSENLNYSWRFDFLVVINRMILWWNFIVFAPNEFQLKGFNNTINTSYLTDSCIVFTLKMESVSKNTIFGLKMMVKSGLEKIFLKFLHTETIFPYFIKVSKITNSVIKITIFLHGGISK